MCDYVLMKELDTRLPYIMRLQGENIVGEASNIFYITRGVSVMMLNTSWANRFLIKPLVYCHGHGTGRIH